MLGIVIITYNIQVDVMLAQLSAIKKFCRDEFQIVVVDNSYMEECRKQIAYHVGRDASIRFYQTDSGLNRNDSRSHSTAANYAYSIVSHQYDNLLFLDHDCIPVKEFSVQQILDGKLYAGIGQGAKAKYIWPGCFMLKNSVVAHNLVDFSTNSKLGLDTGGNLHILIDKYGEENGVFFNEQYETNKEFGGPQYNQYGLINDGMFMHFINASNWADAADQQNRINSLMNILHRKINESEK